MKPMRSLAPIACSLLVAALSGCAGIPGGTRAQEVQTIDELVERTLSDLYKQEPKTRQEIADSVGYAIMDNKITKIPLVGVGSGYGVAINNRTGGKTYIRMERFDLGGGWGARSVRPVVIFQDEKKFKDFTRGEWSASAGAEAAAKVGEAGAAGGAGSGDLPGDKGYSVHLITDAGVSATVTVNVIRVSPIELKE
jgi:lipid-binding SYLF domain-containing protein